jgi:hypothetical protein
MAKRKTPKVEDLRASKIDDTELARLQNGFKSIHQLHNDIGMLEAQKHSYLHGISNVQEAIIEIQKDLKEKYGTFDVDIKDGTINYESNEQADKKD